MPSPLDPEIRTNDLGFHQIATSTATWERVPLAEDFKADSQVSAQLVKRSRRDQGWLTPLSISASPPRGLVIAPARALMSALAEYEVEVSGTVNVPAIASTSDISSRREYLSVVALSCEVSAVQDPSLGEVKFQLRVRDLDNDGNPVLDDDGHPKESIESIIGEVSRRERSFWVLALSPQPLTPEAFLSSLPLEKAEGVDERFLTHGDVDSVRRITIHNQGADGFAVGGLQIYALDPNWSIGKQYPVTEHSVEILPLAEIERRQNYAEAGYVWGNGGEEPLDPDFVVRRATPHENDIAIALRQRLMAKMAGLPVPSESWGRAVLNLSAGFTLTPGRPGLPASAPNGSVCLGSEHRVSYTNQPWTETLAVQQVRAGNDGFGNALVSLSVANFPAGITFSEVATDHRIYTLSGEEVGRFGTWNGLGQPGGLTWTADANQKVEPSALCYVVPAVKVPAGSGFNLPFNKIESAWSGAGQQISSDNILDGASDDLIEYRAPAQGEQYFVVYGAERAALHYIYKRIEVESNSDRQLLLPPTERGCFAFVDGIEGRLDTPVVAVPSANTVYSCLVYYPPRPTEPWQFQMKYLPYQPMTDGANFLEGATIITEPIAFVHSQGGSQPIFQSSADFQYAAIAMHLPAVANSTPTYQLSGFVRNNSTAGVNYPTFASIPVVPVQSLAAPSPGQVLSLVPGVAPQPRSQVGQLTAGGRVLGFTIPPLPQGGTVHGVLAFGVRKGNRLGYVVITKNGASGPVEVNSDTGCAFDVFPL